MQKVMLIHSALYSQVISQVNSQVNINLTSKHTTYPKPSSAAATKIARALNVVHPITAMLSLPGISFSVSSPLAYALP